MFLVGMYRVMPLFGMSTLSVLSCQLVCHTQILLPMQVCRINTLKLHVLDSVIFPSTRGCGIATPAGRGGLRATWFFQVRNQ